MERPAVSYLVKLGQPLREVIATIDAGSAGIALLVDDDCRLLATITDGDVRRAILAGLGPDTAVETLIRPDRHPLSLAQGTSHGELLHFMNLHEVRHLPLLDAAGRVAALVVLDDLVKEYEPQFEAVVMAGGFGTRLRPLTEDIPKPMLPVGDRPLMEHIVRSLQRSGIRRVNITTHYLGEKIEEHFGDGSDFGVEVNYLPEGQPLGTAGALGLLKDPGQPLLVINGDILTGVDFRAMLDFHRHHRAALTVAVREHVIDIPYGVVECTDVRVLRVVEKPKIRHFVAAGIYLLEPDVAAMVQPDQHLDMPDLISRLIAEDKVVVSFAIREYWLDIGKPDDYARAQHDFETGVVR